MNVYVITSAAHPELIGDMEREAVIEAILWPQAVYATLNGAMAVFEREIAEYAQEQAGTLEGIQLPLTVEWKASTHPVLKGTPMTGRRWTTENPFTEETMQIHEMILQ